MSNPLLRYIGTTDTQISVEGPILNVSGAGLIQIESEVISFTSATDTAFFGCVRGVNSTSAATHAAGLAVTIITSQPLGSVIELTGSGAPVDSVTGVPLAGAGSRYTRTSNGTLYLNTGTATAPVWALVHEGTDSGITQLTGDVTAGPGSGSQAATVPNATVIGKVLTGYVSGAGTVAATDTILQGVNKLNGNAAAIKTTADAALPSASFTDAAVTGKLLTGYSSGAGTVAGTDTVLQGINKLNGNDALKLPTASFTDAAVTGKLLTGYSSGAGTVAGTDTVLQGVNKLNGNAAAIKTTADAALPSASFTDAAVTGKLITGYVSGAGTVASTDTILQAIQKLNGNAGGGGGSGTVNSGTAGQVAYYASSTTAVSTTGAFTVGSNGPNGITKGTNSNDSAAAGYVGEYISSGFSGVGAATTATWYDATSIDLTAGDWDVAYGVTADVNEVGSFTNAWIAITQTAGNNGGSQQGQDIAIHVYNGATPDEENLVLPRYRASLSGSATIYAKIRADHTGSTPNFSGFISARRVR